RNDRARLTRLFAGTAESGRDRPETVGRVARGRHGRHPSHTGRDRRTRREVAVASGGLEQATASAFGPHACRDRPRRRGVCPAGEDRKSTRLNSSHVKISYAVFCLKKKKNL